MPKKTLRMFDEICLTSAQALSPTDIRTRRPREYASQTVFARHLNATTGLVSQWEHGEKRPQGASLKLLTLATKNEPGTVA